MSDFLVTHRFDAVANGAAASVLVRVGANNELVLGIDLEASGIWDVLFVSYEDSVIGAVGTALVAVDMDRAKAAAATSLFYHTPTIIGPGTEVCEMAAGDVAVTRVGERRPGPFILEAEGNYVLFATNRSGAAMDIGFVIACSEVPTR